MTAVSNLAIWGNHSSTMFPDFFNAKINGRPVPDVIGQREWLEKDFIATVQKRGAAIIKARGLSSPPAPPTPLWTPFAASPRPRNRATGSAWPSAPHGGYGIAKGLIFSYPVRTDGKKWEIVQNVPLNDFSRSKIATTEAELKEEQSLVADLLPK